PGAGPLVSGTFKPSDFAPADTFPAPASAPSGGSALSAFTATNPNGTWSLYVVDDTTGDSGTLVGWCLDINYSCVGAPASICDDGNVCTDDSCNTTTGRCVHANNTS